MLFSLIMEYIDQIGWHTGRGAAELNMLTYAMNVRTNISPYRLLAQLIRA